ncbi:A/G-specific adenine glycosylase [uncultured Roseivirga sp.]|uniref:A/G-specific adenine glycosylase n=1 Tax=uncultured Roseivirga sp. TaxID=543088 RepID=UPI0030DC02D7|tara:strand:+ start:401601 stop:402668 length:1068 start_codon:yes stop_codon:yes gene_type:complete
MLDSKLFANQLINWYEENKRDLPWRKTKDPYRIWLSEIILQQTRVAQGLPYYERFVEQFPTINDLANASETEVLRLWQGLGYYSRARNLHSCAKMVVNDFDGVFPSDFNELLKLKGIGRYTAAAISSSAFNQPNAVLDGNVYRVLSRVFGIEEDISSTKGPKVFEKRANELLDKEKPNQYNQAIMEFGAIQCSPKSPACGVCPFRDDCFAFNNNKIDSLPVKTKKTKVRKRYLTYLVFQSEEGLWLKERGKGDVWQGLFDFYLIEENKQIGLDEVISALQKMGLTDSIIGEESKLYEHVLTHQRIFANFVKIELGNEDEARLKSNHLEIEKYSLEHINNLPKPVLISKYLEDQCF